MPKIRGIKQLSITAKDVARAKQFYEETLGLKHLFGSGGMEFFDCNGVRILIGGTDGGHSGTSIIYFDVDDVLESHARLSEKGVKFVEDPSMVAKLPDREVWLAIFYDTEQNLLGLMSEKPVAS